MSRADGSVIIDTRLDTKGLSKGVGNLKSQFAGLGSVVGKLGGMIAAAFSVRAIVNFGKEAVKLGSDLQEVQNVVDVTFTTMNEQVNQFAKSAMQAAGLSETMAKRYTGTFGAMAKSFKFSEEDAYAMATSLTQLSGDVASFYNLTQDVAYTKLKSVFTGETETLKDLGVVMTQTALDDFALRKGLAKTTSQMSEQEKVALRYQFVMEQLSGASGDFVRTQDSWANQTRILSLQFEQLKATVGMGLINVLTPVLKVLNELISKFQALAESFREFTTSLVGNGSGSTGIANALKASAENAGVLTDEITRAGNATKKVLAGFDELNILQSGSSSESASTETSVGTISVNGKVDDQVPSSIQIVADKIKELIEPLRQIDFQPAMRAFGHLGGSIKKLGGIISDSLEWAWFNLLIPLSEWTVEELAPAMIDRLSSSFELLSAILAPVLDGLKALWETCKPIFDWMGDTAIWVIDQLREQFDKVVQVIQDKSPEIEKVFNNLSEVITAVWTAIEPILDALKEKFEVVFDVIGDIAAEFSKSIIDSLVGITDFLAGIFTGDWTRALNGLINAVNSLISGILGGINFVIGALNKLSFDIPDWIPEIGGQRFGFNIPTIDIAKYTIPQIPYLAKGAVIPPSAPFYAVLGDQKNGRNLEAPEGLIRDIIKDEISDVFGGMMAGFEAVVEEVRNLRGSVDSIEVGDTTIGQAANRYNRRMAITQGGA